MSDKIIDGDINHEYPAYKADYLFRISLKALVQNEKGKVLVVKETGRSWWDLPGGGMDHGENIKTALTRELREEVRFTGDFTYRVIAVEDPAQLTRINVMQIRLIFLVTPVNAEFEAGEDGDEISFIDPVALKDSNITAEQKVHEYSLLAKSSASEC